MYNTLPAGSRKFARIWGLFGSWLTRARQTWTVPSFVSVTNMLSIESQETETIGEVPVEILSNARIVVTKTFGQISENFDKNF